MIGKHDFRYFKKGSIVPKRLCNAKSRARRSFVFGTDVWVVISNGRCEVYAMYEHDFTVVQRYFSRSGAAHFKCLDILNVSGKQARAAYLLLEQPVRPVGISVNTGRPTVDMLSAAPKLESE